MVSSTSSTSKSFILSDLRSSALSLLSFRLIHNLIFRPKLNTDTIHTMPLIRGRVIPLALKHMPQMPPALRAHNLRPCHAKRAICMSFDGAGNGVKEGRPSAAGLEFVRGFIERGVAGGAGVDSVLGEVLIVFAGESGLGAFFADNAELLRREDRLPFGVCLLNWIRHVGIRRGGCSE